MGTKTMITKDMLIGDIMQIKPSSKDVIEKYFGTGCFTCPGIMWESLSFGATMHNRNADDILEEINAKED
jgi:hybrid cluster-associated redox disulfide protein